MGPAIVLDVPPAVQKEGADPDVLPGRQAPEPPLPAPPAEVHEQGLGAVLPVVAQGDAGSVPAFRPLGEKGPAEPPGGVLQADLFLPGQGGSVPFPAEEGDPKVFA